MIQKETPEHVIQEQIRVFREAEQEEAKKNLIGQNESATS